MKSICKNVTAPVTSTSKVMQSKLRICSLLLVCASFSLGMTSCGVTRAVVQNKATGTTTEIKITTSNPTTVDASPDVSIPLSYGKKNETSEGN